LGTGHKTGMNAGYEKINCADVETIEKIYGVFGVEYEHSKGYII
jgi:hypothetical protein